MLIWKFYTDSSVVDVAGQVFGEVEEAAQQEIERGMSNGNQCLRLTDE